MTHYTKWDIHIIMYLLGLLLGDFSIFTIINIIFIIIYIYTVYLLPYWFIFCLTSRYKELCIPCIYYLCMAHVISYKYSILNYRVNHIRTVIKWDFWFRFLSSILPMYKWPLKIISVLFEKKRNRMILKNISKTDSETSLVIGKVVVIFQFSLKDL